VHDYNELAGCAEWMRALASEGLDEQAAMLVTSRGQEALATLPNDASAWAETVAFVEYLLAEIGVTAALHEQRDDVAAFAATIDAAIDGYLFELEKAIPEPVAPDCPLEAFLARAKANLRYLNAWQAVELYDDFLARALPFLAERDGSTVDHLVALLTLDQAAIGAATAEALALSLAA
jgi:hypothetical protein